MIENKVYPLLFVPKSILNLQKYNVTVFDVFGLSNQLQPKYSVIKTFVLSLIWVYLSITPILFVFLLILSLFFGDKALKDIYILGVAMKFIYFCLPTIFAIFSAYKGFRNYQEEKIKWEAQQKRFRELEYKFNNDKINYQREVKQKKLVKVLEKATASTQYFQSTKFGISEVFFYKHLVEYFGTSISRNCGIMLENIPYRTDFYYFNKKYNLHIDIEIDEPYTYENKEPIHYEGNQHDDYRNMVFLSHNWIVIRFAEEQVVNQPKECCKFIENAIIEICFEKSLLHNIFLKRVKQWNINESSILAKENFRNTYLHQHFK